MQTPRLNVIIIKREAEGKKMIRNLKDNDLDEIMEIWLCSNT